MSITYSTAAKNARLTAVADLIDAGAGPGYIEIGTAGMASVLATIVLTDPSALSVTAGVLTFDFDPDISATAVATGTAAAARIRDSNAVDIITGLTAGTTGTDLILDSTSITSGQTVTIEAASITHA